MSDGVTIAIAGNPNVGKSTVFNKLTGLHQHTGNWAGKTVGNAEGRFTYKEKTYNLVDIPGTYSLVTNSSEEEVARDFLLEADIELTVVVADATCLQRNLNLVLQIMHICKKVVLCVNLLDEAEKKHISVDLNRLSTLLEIPVIGVVARSGVGLEALREAIRDCTQSSDILSPEIRKSNYLKLFDEKYISEILQKSKMAAKICVNNEIPASAYRDRTLDRIFTSKLLGFPIMLLLFILIFWITISGANYPSQMLSAMFYKLGKMISAGFVSIHAPLWLTAPLMDGVYRTLTWVISVMLPPMSIFFPLFTLLEDSGYLPRIAFNLDFLFRYAHAHGKQALTTCMGFGCNACAVTGCRIIDSPRERLIASLTNTFIPCNGRFPALIAVITMFFVGTTALSSFKSALLLTSIILFGFFMSIACSFFLAKTVLKGIPSAFTLELPPYRRPEIGKVIVRSILDRIIFVLARAIVVAAPAGLIIWLMANISIGQTTLLGMTADFLDPLGHLMGLDGVILMGFILGFPANEIVLPIILMTYMHSGTLQQADNLHGIYQILSTNGWTSLTAVCMMILIICHFPCGTTCLTIKKETGQFRWVFLSMLIPTCCGIVICIIVATTARMLF